MKIYLSLTFFFIGCSLSFGQPMSQFSDIRENKDYDEYLIDSLSHWQNVLKKPDSIKAISIRYYDTSMLKDIQKLKNLEYCKIIGYKIKMDSVYKIINELPKLPHLISLYISKVELDSLSEQICNCTKLKYLSINTNKPVRFTMCRKVPPLKDINIEYYYNNMKDKIVMNEIPNWIFQFKKLKRLNINHAISSIPKDIKKLKKLRLLGLVTSKSEKDKVKKWLPKMRMYE